MCRTIAILPSDVRTHQLPGEYNACWVQREGGKKIKLWNGKEINNDGDICGCFSN